MRVKISKSEQHGNFNKGSITQTTSNVGDVQPFLFRNMTPHEKFTIDSGAKVQCMPMISPSFAKLMLKQDFSLVKVCDIWRPWHSYYSGEPYAYISSTALVTSVPFVDLGKIFLTLLAYDKSSQFYRIEEVQIDTKTGRYVMNANSEVRPISTAVTANTVFNLTQPTSPYARTLANACCQRLLQGSYSIDPYTFVNDRLPLEDESETTTATVLDYILPCSKEDVIYNIGGTDKTIYIERGIGVRLGEFGLKLRKMFLGLGFNIDSLLTVSVDETTYEPVFANGNHNILPFIGYAKCIYDVYGIRKFSDYQSTNVGRLISTWNGQNILFTEPTLGSVTEVLKSSYDQTTTNQYTMFSNLCHVMIECLYNSFYTLDIDLFSSVNNTVGRAYGASSNVKAYITKNISTNVIATNELVQSNYPQYPLLNNLANRLLHLVNTDNVIGASLYKWFKEKFNIEVDNDQTLRSTLINKQFINIDIDPLYSQTGGMSGDNDGSSLGDIGGKGYGEGRLSKSFRVTASDFSYLYCFGCIVPRVGYYQGLNGEYLRGLPTSDRYDFYNPDWDSMGYVAMPTALLHAGTRHVGGLMPRYFDLKFAPNDVVSGDLNRQNTSLSMESYWYQRQLCGNENISELVNGTLLFTDKFRKIGMDNSLGRFLRVFQNQLARFDHFVIHMAFDINSRANMLPISDSFDTEDDEMSTGETTKA